MFTLNKTLAQEYDQRGGFINQAGKYIGKIESAVWHIGNSKKGRSENIRLTFISNTNQKATFFINTSYQDGIVNEGGIRTVNALLACLKMRESGDPTPTTITEYNKDTKQEEKVQRECFVNWHNKPIGVVVQMVHEDGRETPSAQLYSLFDPQTEMVASEILNRETQPQQLAKIMQYIAQKPLIDKRNAQPSNSYTPPPPSQRPAGTPTKPVDDLDDDIPF